VVVGFARRGFAHVIFFFIGCFGFSGCGFARRGLGFAREVENLVMGA
jgi:hypothetical protein